MIIGPHLFPELNVRLLASVPSAAWAEQIGLLDGPWYRLLRLTGGRRGEWAMARWDWSGENMSRLEVPALSYASLAARP
jgi:hypothetical protein